MKPHLLPSILLAPNQDADYDSEDETSKGFSKGDGEERDEVKEVERASKGDTARILRLRLVATLLLLVTACAVTMITYILLVNEQDKNFMEAFNQFSRSLGEAALRQQLDISDSLAALAHTYTSTARAMNATWPMFLLPDFEVHAFDTMALSSAEMLYIGNFVKHQDRESYETFMNDSISWVEDSHITKYGDLSNLTPILYKDRISSYDFALNEFGPSPDLPEYMPFGSFSPPPVTYYFINVNGGAVAKNAALVKILKETRNETIVGSVFKFDLGDLAYSEDEHDAFHSSIVGSSKDFPHSAFTYPIHDSFDHETSEIVATIKLVAAWDVSMRNLIPAGVDGLQVVLTNTCNQTYTYAINGPDAFYLGEGDMHDTQFDGDMEYNVTLTDNKINYPETNAQCSYSLHIYPSAEFQSVYKNDTPLIFAIIVACTFVLVAVVFFCYDMFVQSRNTKIVLKAARSNAIVSSLFPGNIRDQLLEQGNSSTGGTKSNKMKSFLRGSDGNEKSDEEVKSKPLAELFLETTVMFADIVGFTAFSSTREPSQVFMLLESVYSAFDRLARRRRVFKVETVGDCYVAVTGLPDPRSDHAQAMARFAHKIIRVFRSTVKRLEVSLGPSTGDLELRIGIHSGAVTAGVLRGERSRFQLFGDTMNTTARMESTSKKSRIQLSQATADLLTKVGKSHWLVPRSTRINAKGLGSLQTYWLVMEEEEMTASASVSGSEDEGLCHHNRRDRLIEWNTGTLLKLIRQVIASREVHEPTSTPFQAVLHPVKNPLEEVVEIIKLPEFTSKQVHAQRDPESIEIGPETKEQLRTFVTCIADRYHENLFHNFEHASHVVMSVMKCLSRIIAPSELEEEMQIENGSAAAKLHDHTYGITSDPLTQLACVFSALIHDVDHCGVQNAQLVKEGSQAAVTYKERSVAEQNSLDIAWELLMEERFAVLRACMFGTADDLRRFRELVVNSVMATDIADKELKDLRNGRWQKAFAQEKMLDESPEVAVNRKATIVIEHLIQASDISHTMQHWNVYRKWNERLFRELHLAYKAGRGSDPAEFWVKGELGFFDFYIIPLAKKLKECGVFGITSDEFLTYAIKNRQEWEERGAAVVAEMIENFSYGELVEV